MSVDFTTTRILNSYGSYSSESIPFERPVASPLKQNVASSEHVFADLKKALNSFWNATRGLWGKLKTEEGRKEVFNDVKASKPYQKLKGLGTEEGRADLFNDIKGLCQNKKFQKGAGWTAAVLATLYIGGKIFGKKEED